jgi:hypothetical protein
LLGPLKNSKKMNMDVKMTTNAEAKSLRTMKPSTAHAPISTLDVDVWGDPDARRSAS